MNKQSNLALATSMSLLQTMGIPLWTKRSLPNTQLFFLEPKLFIPVLVILQRKVAENSEAEKILQGMLKVLNLTSEEMCFAWCLEKNNETPFNATATQEALRYWQPKQCLFLGNIFESSMQSPDCFITHHPETLLAKPELKRAAYEVLLALKARLNEEGVSA